MAQSGHESSINWNGYAKIVIHIATRLFEAPIEASSVYVLLMIIELSTPSIDKQERLLFTTLDIGAASINMDVKCAIVFRTTTEQINHLQKRSYQTV